MSALTSRIERTIRDQKGIVFAAPAIVYRNTYTGRGVIGDNRTPGAPDADERGYVPVEWWIMSLCVAENPVSRLGEGLTRLRLEDGSLCALGEAAAAAEARLFGGDLARWPLAKILDIGGHPVRPDFSTQPEIPPIPPHVHAGKLVAGRLVPPGKLEAYFFPPSRVNVGDGSVVTRLGLRPGVTKADFHAAVREFGTSDRFYTLLNEFPVAELEGWTIPPRVVHSPGPWTTLEIQTPQDDFNLLGWQLGQRLTRHARREQYESLVLRGLRDAEHLLEEAIDWEQSSRADFRAAFHRPARELEGGSWGRRLRVFFDAFDGEAIELRAGGRWRMPESARPVAIFTWSGRGGANCLEISSSANSRREFLIAPGHAVEFINAADEDLVLFAIFPLTTDVT